MLRKFFVLLFALLVACVPAMPKQPDISYMNNVTVALIDEDQDAYCSGTWISDEMILTAAHCVSVRVPPMFKGLIEEPDPIGDPVDYATREEPRQAHKGFVARVDKEHDIALVRALAPQAHAVAKVAKGSPAISEPVYCVGHEYGLEWSFQKGYVQAYRTDEGVREMQMAIAAGGGDSGAAVFNENGEIVGVVQKMIRGSSITFALHRDHVAEFLK